MTGGSSLSPLWLGSVVFCMAILSWMPPALSQEGDGIFFDTGLVEPQAGTERKFPYCSCYRPPANPSPYSFLSTITVPAKGQYCFTLSVNTTGCNTGRCCDVDLKKIEFDINGKCNVKSASVKATVAGRFTSTGPNIYIYKMDDGTLKCDMNKAITPYYTLPDISTEPGRRRGSKLYCFTIDKVPEQFYNRTNGCRSVERVEKIEIYADEFRRRNVTGVRIKPNGGPARWISPSWGPSGSDTFKGQCLKFGLINNISSSPLTSP
ncbi:hypothetical protein Vafri_5983 [Volvox africanus]|nr:hypothetical protein Vafri_5983 [Volvox africanus]